MRASFSDALVSLASTDPKILLLTGDHGYALFDAFRNACPKQYINAGIAEQNMIGMAAGLARAGFRPIVYGLSAFIPIRVIEQIKLDVAHDNLPVIFIGDGAGFVYSHLGTSHQCTEDIACVRAIPNLSIYSPCDQYEMAFCMTLAYQSNSPVYIRVGKADLGACHYSSPGLTVGDLVSIRDTPRSQINFIATGSMVRKALDLADEVYHEASVWSAPFIKPINTSQVVKICQNSRLIVVFEEHSVMGGLGSIISEISSEFVPTRILRIGVNDKFSMHCGSYSYLLNEHKLDNLSIIKRINNFILDI